MAGPSPNAPWAPGNVWAAAVGGRAPSFGFGGGLALDADTRSRLTPGGTPPSLGGAVAYIIPSAAVLRLGMVELVYGRALRPVRSARPYRAPSSGVPAADVADVANNRIHMYVVGPSQGQQAGGAQLMPTPLGTDTDTGTDSALRPPLLSLSALQGEGRIQGLI